MLSNPWSRFGLKRAFLRMPYRVHGQISFQLQTPSNTSAIVKVTKIDLQFLVIVQLIVTVVEVWICEESVSKGVCVHLIFTTNQHVHCTWLLASGGFLTWVHFEYATGQTEFRIFTSIQNWAWLRISTSHFYQPSALQNQQTLISASILSRLDCRNSLVSSCAQFFIHRLQKVSPLKM